MTEKEQKQIEAIVMCEYFNSFNLSQRIAWNSLPDTEKLERSRAVVWGYNYATNPKERNEYEKG